MRKIIEMMSYFMPDGIVNMAPAMAYVPVEIERWEDEGGRIFTAKPWMLYPVFYK